MGNPFPVSLAAESRKATKILREFTSADRVDRVVPSNVLARAKGFAIFSVFRIGFLMSARGGAGVVVARLPNGSWSPPAAIGLGGLGGGFNVGAEVTDFLIVLTSRRAVSTFMATGSLQLGGNMALAVGPLGRAAEAGGRVSTTGKLAAILSYSKSKGLYGGISLEGTILMNRSDANAKAYGSGIKPQQILAGQVDTPDFAWGLTEILNQVSGRTHAQAYGHQDRSSILSPASSSTDRSFDSVRSSTGTRGQDPFGDSDEDAATRTKSLRDPLYERGASRRTTTTFHNDTSTSHWTPEEEMDDFDRELQRPGNTKPGRLSKLSNKLRRGSKSSESSSSSLKNGFRLSKSKAGTAAPTTEAWADHYSFSGGGGDDSLYPQAHRNHAFSVGADSDDDSLDQPSYRSAPRLGDYESALSVPRRTRKTSVGNRATSPIEQDHRSSRGWNASYSTPSAISSRTTASSSNSGGNTDDYLVMAKYAYQPEGGETDISFVVGDVIRVTKRTATRDDWWAGECHGKVGYFPANWTVDV